MKSSIENPDGVDPKVVIDDLQDAINGGGNASESSENFKNEEELQFEESQKKAAEYLIYLTRHGGDSSLLSPLAFDIKYSNSLKDVNETVQHYLEYRGLKDSVADRIKELFSSHEKVDDFQVGDFVNWKNHGFSWSEPKRVKSFGDKGMFYVDGLKAPLLIENFKKISDATEKVENNSEEEIVNQTSDTKENEDDTRDRGLVRLNSENADEKEVEEDESEKFASLTEDEKRQLYSEDPYEVFGLSSDEMDLDNITKIWKKLRVRFNTDDPNNNKTGEDFTEISKRINIAYEKIVKRIKNKMEFSFEAGVFILRGRKFRMFDPVIVERSNGKIEKDWFFVGAYEHKKMGNVVTVQGKAEDGSGIQKDIPVDEFLSWQDKYKENTTGGSATNEKQEENSKEENDLFDDTENSESKETGFSGTAKVLGPAEEFEVLKNPGDTVIDEKLLDGEIATETEEPARERLDKELASARSDYAQLLIEWKNKHREKKSWYRKIADDLGFEKQMPDSEMPQELLDAEKAYIIAKKNKSKNLFGVIEKRVKRSADSILEYEFDFNTKILEQSDEEYRIFQKRLMENLPPLEKGRVGRLFEKWNKLPLPARIATTSALLTGVGLLSGTVAIGGAGAALLYRGAKAAFGTTAGQIAGKAYGGRLQKEVDRIANEQEERYGEGITEENYEERERERMRFKEQESNQLKRNILKKGAVIGAVAGITNIGEDLLAKGVFGGVPGHSVLENRPRVGQEIASSKGVGATEMDPVKVELNSRGFVQTFDDLKTKMKLKFPNPETAPKNVKEFLDTDNTKLAIKYGFYDPEKNLSGLGMKGEQIGFDSKGDFVYKDLQGTEKIMMDSNGENLHSFKDIGGKMFNSEAVPLSDEVIPPGPKISPTIDISEPTPASSTGIEDASEIVKNMETNPVPVSKLTESLGVSRGQTGFDMNFDSKTFHIDTPNIAGNKEILVDGVKIAEQVQSPNGLGGTMMKLADKYQEGKKYAAIREAFSRAQIQDLELLKNSFKAGEGHSVVDIPFENGKINIFKGIDENKDAVKIFLNGKEIANGLITEKGPSIKIFNELKGGLFLADTVYERAFKEASKVINKLK